MTSSAEESSSAEAITRLRAAIEGDEERLANLRQTLEDPQGEYQLAEAAFQRTDEELQRRQSEYDHLDDAVGNSKRVQAEEALRAAETQRELARQRFDLAVEERKTIRDQIEAIEAKLRDDRDALDRMTGDVRPESLEAASNAATPAEPSLPKSPEASAPTTSESSKVQPSDDVKGLGNPVEAAAPENVVTAPLRPEVVEAQQQAQETKADAESAEDEAKTVAERIQIVQKNVELEAKLMRSAQEKADVALRTRNALAAEHERLAESGADAAALRDVSERRRESDELFRNSRLTARNHAERLSALQGQLVSLQREELQTLSMVDEKRKAAEEAESRLSKLQNPFTVQNMLQWLLDHGPRISGIVLAMLALQWFVRIGSARIIGLLLHRSMRGTLADREDRARTLAGVFQNAATVTVVVGGVLMICEEAGIAVGPLLGGAAVVGLAVAFGAQNLIRDYFYGFVILLENQYRLNDVLRIGDISGQVEQITLRMTVLRDLEGHVHFIPNGKIDSVTNMTHGWSRALFDIGVAYKEDVDQVMDVLMQLARELRNDPNYMHLILDDAEMLGVDAFGDSAVTIRFFLKTRPLKQWTVKRELLRRIKRRFDELGIEIPFPQRTLHHRMDHGFTSRGELFGSDATQQGQAPSA